MHLTRFAYLVCGRWDLVDLDVNLEDLVPVDLVQQRCNRADLDLDLEDLDLEDLVQQR